MIIGVLQARLSSTRLPGKVLEDVHGIPMILRQIERLSESVMLDKLVVATSTDSSDDALVDVLVQAGVAVRRGPLNDVLERFALIVEEFQPDVIVRLTADCPLADVGVVDEVIRHHVEHGASYTSNVLEPTFPDGLDVECITRNAFDALREGEVSTAEREHVTLGIYSQPDRFSLESVTQEPNLSGLRWTVDVQEDLDFVRAIYEHLYDDNHSFRQQEILDLLEKKPELSRTDIAETRNAGSSK
jgi:spore coat polysaccharide biosynthesis protein SpsF